MELMNMSVQFGKRCKILRQERGLTQQQVADALGISRSAYAYYEIGGSEPSLSVLWEYWANIYLRRIWKQRKDQFIW